MSNELSNAERETHLNMTGDNHKQWVIYTDGPYWIARLDKITTATKVTGNGKHYVLDASQVSIRNKRKPMTEEQKAQSAMRLRQARGK